MKRIILCATMFAATSAAFAGQMVVYGSKSETSTTTKKDEKTGMKTTTVTIVCSGDMSKVCYTTTTGSPGTGTVKPEIGRDVRLSIYENGAVVESHSGILRELSRSSERNRITVSEK